MAAIYNPAALVLISAFTSLQDVIVDQMGPYVAKLVKNRFNNKSLLSTSIICPVFFLHGQSDTLIPCEHTQILHSICKAPSSMVLPREMDHNAFDFYDEFC